MVKQLYLAGAIVGTVLPYAFFILVLWVLVFTEGRRLGMRHRWVYILCNLVVGVSLALPLFLYVRAGKQEAHA